MSYRPEEVTYEAAVPAAGYELEIEESGPGEVRVEFTSESGPDYEIRARWDDGQFETEISEKS